MSGRKLLKAKRPTGSTSGLFSSKGRAGAAFPSWSAAAAGAESVAGFSFSSPTVAASPCPLFTAAAIHHPDQLYITNSIFYYCALTTLQSNHIDPPFASATCEHEGRIRVEGSVRCWLCGSHKKEIFATTTIQLRYILCICNNLYERNYTTNSFSFST